MTGGRRGWSRSRPVYARTLRLYHVDLSDLVCFVLFEGMIAFGALLALAELVTWWAVLVLPATVAVMVKINDLIAGALASSAPTTGARQAATAAAGDGGSRVAAGPPLPFGVRRVGRDRAGTLYRVDPPWWRIRESAHRRVDRWRSLAQGAGRVDP